jgi:hypothetical protein
MNVRGSHPPHVIAYLEPTSLGYVIAGIAWRLPVSSPRPHLRLPGVRLMDILHLIALTPGSHPEKCG